MNSVMTSVYLDFIKQRLSVKKVEHSKRTAQMAVKMCHLYRIDKVSICETAAILHDVGRNLNLEESRLIIEDGGESVEDFEKGSLSLIHSHAGALIVEKSFPYLPFEVKEAVRYHTVGHPDMSNVAKIIFLADYCEYGRTHVSDEFRSKIFHLPIDQAILLVLQDTFRHLIEKERIIALPSILLYNKLIEQEAK